MSSKQRKVWPRRLGLLGGVLGLWLGVLCWPGCGTSRPKGETRGQQVPPSTSLRVDFEQGDLLASWQGGFQATKVTERLQVVSSPVFAGNGALQVTVRPGDWAAGGSRAEIVWSTGAAEGREGWYRWKVYIPKTYEDIRSLRDEQRRPNWQVMGQWHDTPRPGDSTSHSPPVSLRYMLVPPPDDQNRKDLKEAVTMTGFQESWRNQPVFLLSYGAPPSKGAFVAVQKGTWHDVLLHIRWSQQDDGFVEMWLDQQPVTQGKLMGKNMYNELPNYFKLGLYRNPDIPISHTVYYDDLRFGLQRDEVSP